MYASSSFTVFDSTRLIGTENEDSGLPGVGTAAGTSAMGSITADIHGMVFFDMDEDICMMPTTENDTQVRRPPSPTSPKTRRFPRTTSSADGGNQTFRHVERRTRGRNRTGIPLPALPAKSVSLHKQRDVPPGTDRHMEKVPAKSAATPGQLQVTKWHGPLEPMPTDIPASAIEPRGAEPDAADVCLDWRTSMTSDDMATGVWGSDGAIGYGIEKGSSDLLGPVDVADPTANSLGSNGTAFLPCCAGGVALLVGVCVVKRLYRGVNTWVRAGEKGEPETGKNTRGKFEGTPKTSASVQAGVTEEQDDAAMASKGGEAGLDAKGGGATASGSAPLPSVRRRVGGPLGMGRRTGLSNDQGQNRCHLHTALQLLFRDAYFFKTLVGHSKAHNLEDAPFMKTLATLFKDMEYGEETKVNVPDAILEKLAASATNEFIIGQQEDVASTFLGVLTIIREEEGRCKIRPSVAAKMGGGTLVTSRFYHNCKKKDQREDPPEDMLRVPVPHLKHGQNGVHLSYCLNQALAEERSSSVCDECWNPLEQNMKIKAAQQGTGTGIPTAEDNDAARKDLDGSSSKGCLRKLPETLVIHLMRFKGVRRGSKVRMTKIRTPVEIPPQLHLSKYAEGQTRAVYKLGAVAHHLSCAVGHESDLNKAGEHYTAAFARPHNGADKLQWLICDDAICSSQETVVALRQAKENADVVMYSKVS